MHRFLVVIEKMDEDYSAYSPDLSVSESPEVLRPGGSLKGVGPLQS